MVRLDLARRAADLALGHALTGLAVSVAGNVGHIQAIPGAPVTIADRLTAGTSPLAAFAGLSVGLLVVKMIRLSQAREPTRKVVVTEGEHPVKAAAGCSRGTALSGIELPLAE
jgi:hypothetical protein